MSISVPRPIITLTTDFGFDSSYVAQMKGVILSRNPDVNLVDVSHSIAPQDVGHGALVLADAYSRFPARTIHVAVVDPGVGTDRKLVYAQMGTHRFLAPNNGLLTLIAQRVTPSQLITLDNRMYFLPNVSSTFHGRDILAPVAAHLSLGLNPRRLGSPLDALTMLSFAKPIVEAGKIVGHVLHIDSFGNLITNITAEDLGDRPQLERDRAIVQIRNAVTEGLAETYGTRPPGSVVAVVGSNGRLEVAVVNGNAANALSAKVGDDVLLTWSERPT